MKFNKIYLGLLMLLALYSCKEEERFATSGDDTTPPGQVTIREYKPLYGGARFFYDIPNDEDVLSVEAVYTNKKDRTFTFNASFFVDSLDIYGFEDLDSYTVHLYAIDRAGNRSQPTEIDVTGLEPAFRRVANTLEVKPGFSSFFAEWENELEQNINVYIDFEFPQDGQIRHLTSVFSSNMLEDKRFINDLYLQEGERVKVQVRVEDKYGNMTDPIDKGEISLYQDLAIPKLNWMIPEPNDSIGGVPMVYGNALEGRSKYVIDGILNEGDNLNFMHTRGRGRTGNSVDGNMPWNFIIDLGDHYEISRIITHQRHSGGLTGISRGQFYRSENVGIYNFYIWDDATETWELVMNHKIPEPLGMTDLDVIKLGQAGDMAYMYPDDPKYTKPTRWVRYEALKGFTSNYTLEDANSLSEITLYGKPIW